MPHRVTLSRSEGSVVLGSEMLRCAQGDSAMTYADAWINLLKCMIGTYGGQGYFVNCRTVAMHWYLL